MLHSIREFSKTKYAKIIFVIMIIPFVLWGMGDVFRGGSKNTIATINEEKISVVEYVNYLRYLNVDFQSVKQNLKPKLFEDLLNKFVSEKLINLELNELGIIASDELLISLIEEDKNFQNKNKFSRAKYEKFLIEKGITATTYENALRKKTSQELFHNFITNGIKSPLFLINEIYNEKNKNIILDYISLDKYYKEQNIISDKKN